MNESPGRSAQTSLPGVGRARDSMSSSGRTGAQNGRCGGRLSGGKRAASALAHAPKVRVIGRATGGVRVVVQEESEQLPASPTAQAAKVMGIADAIADALGLSPGGLKVAKIDGR